jgi:SAM-dependent methyltransferase
VTSTPTIATDAFGPVAEAYAAFRPRYPRAVFHYLAAVAPSTHCVLDVAAGSGQATLGLAAHFARVVAVDLSTRQLGAMPEHPRVHRVSAHAESLPIRDHAVDLVLAAQALHWFDEAAFFKDAARVLRPRGIVAVLAYDLSRITPAIDRLVRDFHDHTVGADWTVDRAKVMAGYATAKLPGTSLAVAQFVMTASLTADAYLGYLSTWSAVTRYRARTGHDPLTAFGEALRAEWGDAPRTVHWPLRLRCARL